MKKHTFHQAFYHCLFIGLLIPLLNYANASADNPQQIIREMSEQFEKKLLIHQKEIKKNAAIADELINKYLVPNVNFPLMSRYVLGKNWKKATATQQQEFIKLFKQLLIRFYSKAFIEYLQKHSVEKGMINFLPFRGKKGAKSAKVKIEIKVNADTPPIQVKYTLYKGKSLGWKIYDISVEGISLVTSYRSTFKQIVAKEKMSGLIAHLQKKINTFKQ